MKQGAFLRAIICALCFLMVPLAALAQDETASESTDRLTQAIRDAADSGLSVIVIDSAGNLVRSGLPDDAPVAAAPGVDGHMEGGSAMMQAQSRVRQFRETLTQRLASMPVSLNEVRYILRATSPDGRIMTYVETLLWTLVFLAVGMIVAIRVYARKIIRNYVVGRVLEAPQGYREKMPFLVFRFFMGISVTVVAMLVAYVLSLLVLGSNDDISLQFTLTAIYIAFFVSRTVSDMWRMILSPFLTQYRIPHFSDRDAKKLFYWASTLAAIDALAIVFSTWIHDFGLNYNVYAILYGGITLFAAVLNILMILFNRRAVSLAICNGKSREQLPWLVRTVAVAWAPLLVGYVIFGWFELAFDLVLEQPQSIPMVAGAYGVMMSIIIVYGVISYLIERYFDRFIARNRLNADMEARDAEEELRTLPRRSPSITTYEELARRVAGILAFVAGSYALLRVWDPQNTVLNESFVGRTLDIVTIIFIGYIVYSFFRIWIDSRIAEEGTPHDEMAELGDEGGAASVSRLGTLLPLFRGAILAVVVVSITLIVLLELGINVSPLFAGAGVVGLAIGFGAQTLVRDIFSGAFFLIDDAFRKGEYIDIGDVKGTVEKISVRSFQLRHHLGALNTIPFGEIKVLTNYSRDWVIMKLPLRVTYDTDVEKVRKLIKKLGQELLDDPVIGENFLQPLKSQGVIEMQDSAMIIRVKFMTKPGDQWLVRKKVYEEIRALFAREGIRFAHREVTVRLADGKADDLTPEQREALTGAVQAAIEDDFEDMRGVGGGDDR